MSKKIFIFLGILLLVYIIIFSKNGLISRRALEKKERELRNEVQELKKDVEKNDMIVKNLKSDSVYIEKLAREKYGMIKPREKYFKIKKNQGGKNGFSH